VQDAPSAWPALLAFVTVVALIPAALWVLKRLQAGAPGAGRIVTVVGGLALGPRERIAVVEADGRRWMIGVTAQSVSLIAELERVGAPDGAGTAEPRATASSAAPPPSSTGFARLLDRMRRDA
jgi:flagellar protein FliO/FliZ